MGRNTHYLIKTWISVLVNMNYFYTKLDINLCHTRLKSKVVIKCAILDNYDLGFLDPFFCDMYIMYIAEFTGYGKCMHCYL